MSKASDLKTVCRLAFASKKGANHEERLESFYNAQADDYDSFRDKFLSGREELWREMGVVDGGVWVDMGGGTGRNVFNFGENLKRLKKVYVVDLSESLLKNAQKKIAANGWTNVETVKADATTWTPPEGKVDFVTFSYSLTMIPDWFAALDQAFEILKPGGKIGVVDFYIARKYPGETFPKQKWGTRTFWPLWFGCDNVYPNCDHPPYLAKRFERLAFREWKDRIPYFPIPGVKTPRYYFVGRKPSES